jgi:GNAT superfamily N-acetyltransferase
MTLWRVRATVDDRPGFLAVLTASLALRAINILAVQVHTTEAGAVDDFLVDAPDQLTEAELLAAVRRGRGRDAWVSRADPYGLLDLPTHALGLAHRLVQDPESLGAVLGALVGGSVSSGPAPGGAEIGLAGHTMRLPTPAGGCYLVTRDAPEFTPAEYARAQALVDLAATATRQAAAQASLLLPDSTEIAVRLAGRDDLDAVRAMHERCSATSRHRRYPGDSGPSAERLGRLLAPSRGLALAASVGGDGTGHTRGDGSGWVGGDGSGCVGGERVVALANLIGEGVLAEAAVLVEDGWQRRGIGTALLRRLVRLGTDCGYAALLLHTLVDNGAMLRTLGRLGRPYTVDRDGPVVTMTLPLQLSPGPAPARAPATEGSGSRGVPVRPC